MSEIVSLPPLPDLDLQVLALQLRLLYEKAWKAARDHDEILREKGVPNTYSTGWYQSEPEFSLSDDPSFNIDTDGDFYWSGTDRDGDYISMSVPATVLTGEWSIKDWADYTYKKYASYVAAQKEKEHEKWLLTKDRRREQYERLKAEFENDGEEAGATTG